MDFHVGKLIQFLSREKILKNTLIVITSDHGESFGEHKEFQHGYFVYNTTLRIPLLFYLPEKLSPKSVTTFVSLVDVAPTILDICDIEIPDPIQGKSLLQDPQSRPIYCETNMPRYDFGCCPLTGIIDKGWKYIHAPDRSCMILTSIRKRKITSSNKKTKKQNFCRRNCFSWKKR